MAEKYHGKVVLAGAPLPARAEFASAPDVSGEFLFHLDHIHDHNSRTPVQGYSKTYNRNDYTPLWIGTVQGGTKVVLRVLGIKPWFMIRVPSAYSGTPGVFAAEVLELERRCSIAVVESRPFKGYAPAPISYLRVETHDTFTRARMVKAAQEAGYETAFDDIGAYRLCTNREYKYQPCGWNRIAAATPAPAGIVRDDILFLDVDIEAISGLDVDFTLAEWRHLARPPTLTSSWDIETYNSENTGQAPLYDEIVAGRRIDMVAGQTIRRAAPGDRLQAIITMAAVTLAWASEPEPFLSVVFTILPAPPNPRCLIVQCRNVREVIAGFAGLIRSMQIDIKPAFNDGLYDWPFILSYMRYYSLEAEFAASGVLADPSSYDAKPDSVSVKLEAQQQTQQYFYSTPGYICVDVRNVFRRLMPTAEKSSLAFFLETCKLGGKEDMPIQTMFKIFRVVRQAQLGLYHELYRREKAAVASSDVLRRRVARAAARESGFDELRAWLLRQNEEAPFALGRTSAGKPLVGRYEPADISTYGIENLTRAAALEMFDRIADTIEYCRVDAARCQQLLLRRNVIADARDFGNLTSTNLIDNFNRAGGMKVRNTVMQYALRPEWGLAVGNYKLVRVEKSTSKYPGAYVVPPMKSLYPSREGQEKVERHLGVADTVAVSGTVGRRPARSTAADPPRQPAPTFAGLVAEYCNPPLRDDHSVIIGFTLEGYPIRVLCRPIYGEDYSSLYPSVDMTRNLSPEMIIREESAVLALRSKINPATRKPYRFREILFEYGPPGSTAKRQIRAWCVQYEATKTTPPGGRAEWSYAGMGIYPHILKQLFDRRAQVKRAMGTFAGPRELLDSDRVKLRWPSAVSPGAASAAPGYDGVAEGSCDWFAADKAFLDAYIEARRAELEAAAAASIIPVEQGGTGRPNKFFTHKIAEHETNAKWFAANYTSGTLGALYEDIDYKFNYYNSKQNTLKVFMNTFYGETGNSVSAFFMVEVAGGITTGGREALHYVKSHIEANDYIPTYGDTDSLYPMSPNVIFAEIDYLYYSGAISKAIYWTRLIEITMQDADRLSDEIAALLEAWTGTPFLKMAYEEVLWPYALWGKKIYGGIKHEGIANLAATLPGIEVEAFKAHKSLFTRGIGAKKRGASPIMQLVVYEIIRNCFAMDNTRTMMEIVTTTLDTVRERKWSPDKFVRTAVYKLPGRKLDGTPKAGNPTVQGFIARIRDIESRYPDIGIAVPEVGCRYNYVAVRRAPFRYDMRGRRTAISTHERHEFYEALYNKAYQALPGVGELVIDIDYYITDEIIGQLTRMVCYHETFDHLTEAVADDDDDAAYKRADKTARNAAAKYLADQYRMRHPTPDAGGDAKADYRVASAAIKSRWDESYAWGGRVLRVVQNSITGTEAENTDAKVVQTIREAAAATGRKAATSWWAAAVAAHGRDYARAARSVHGAAKYIRAAAAAQLASAEIDLRKLVTDFRHACKFEVDLLQATIAGGADLEVGNVHADAIVDMNAIYYRMLAAAKSVAALEITEEAAIAARRAASGDISVPKAIIAAKPAIADAYAAWIVRSGAKLPIDCPL